MSPAAARRAVGLRTPGAPACAIADGMYAWLLPGVASFGTWLQARPAPVRALALRFGPARGVLLFLASLGYDRVGVVRTDPGWRALLLLRALLGRRRKLVVLQFIRHPVPGRVWPRIDRWAVRRAMADGHVLTPWERDEYADAFGVARSRFHVIPWPWRATRGGQLPAEPESPLVVCSGRAFCDWPTLFAAARRRGRGSAWPLLAVCASAELARVRALAAGTGAEVRSELSASEHASLLARATVSVIAMAEAGVSQGHVRLMDANEAGVAVVATATRSLEGYVVPGETAILVPPGDPAALRAAVDRVLEDPARRTRMRQAAFERSQRWTGEDYRRAVAELVLGGQLISGPDGHR